MRLRKSGPGRSCSSRRAAGRRWAAARKGSSPKGQSDGVKKAASSMNSMFLAAGRSYREAPCVTEVQRQ